MGANRQKCSVNKLITVSSILDFRPLSTTSGRVEISVENNWKRSVFTFLVH